MNPLPDIRPPLVAGYFYPASPKELTEQVSAFFREAKTPSIKGEVHGLIVPHAGYVYSGQVAASGYATLPRHLKRFFILAALHNRVDQYFKFALPRVDAFSTPAGTVPVSDITEDLLENELFSEVPQAHTSHVIEVQLPFLHHIFDDFEIVPIVAGSVDAADIAGAVDALLPLLDHSTALIVSSDLSHYHHYSEAVRLDHECLDAFAAMDVPRAVHAEACGLPAALILIEAAKRKGWKSALVDYQNSGDTSGDRTRVVGYGSVAYYSGVNS